MNIRTNNPFRIQLINLLLALVLAASPALFAASSLLQPQAIAAPRMQAALADLAAASPDASVRVIVQKSINDGRVEQLIRRLGGEITTDLYFINALAARMTASTARALAGSDGVSWVSLDGPMQSTLANAAPALSLNSKEKDEGVDTDELEDAFNFTVQAPAVWNEAPAYLQGEGVTIAVVDSGINKSKDLKKRIVDHVNFSVAKPNKKDYYGHGTFLAGIIGGDGKDSKGEHMGIAPQVNLLDVRVSDSQGASYESDVVAGLQWIYENHEEYNIRVVNLSLNAAAAQAYYTSPLNAAVELLWFNEIVVVVSAGNSGSAGLFPPANDPFVITVGASDDMGTPDISDDEIAGFSAYGAITVASPFADTEPYTYSKPDLMAPGVNIIGYLPKNNKLEMGLAHPAHAIDKDYFRMSGTSISAPIVAAAAALLLEDEPELNPDQVKGRLVATANTNWAGYNPDCAGAGIVDIYAAIHGDEGPGGSGSPSNVGVPVSHLLWDGILGESVQWGSVQWGSVQWGSVQWGSVQWGSVQWGSVQWGSVQWGSVQWDADYWED